MKQKEQQIHMIESLFYPELVRDFESYKRGNTVEPLLNRLLEALQWGVMNPGIGNRVTHDFECYFFPMSSSKQELEVKQIEREFQPEEFQLIGSRNTFLINRHRIHLKMEYQGVFRTMEYSSKTPNELLVTDYIIEKGKKIEKTQIFHKYSPEGLEMERIVKTPLHLEQNVFEKVKGKLGLIPVEKVQEQYRDSEYPEKIHISTCDGYHSKTKNYQFITNEVVYLEPSFSYSATSQFSNLYHFDKLYQGTGILSDDEKTAYYQALKSHLADYAYHDIAPLFSHSIEEGLAASKKR